MTTQHTPGPFWISQAETGYAIGEGDVQLATGLERSTAHLWKAAPDLLAAVKKLPPILRHLNSNQKSGPMTEVTTIALQLEVLLARIGQGE